MTFKFCVTLEFSRRHGNLKTKRFAFVIEYKPIDWTWLFHYQWLELFGFLKEIGIKSSVAFLKRFSILSLLHPREVHFLGNHSCQGHIASIRHERASPKPIVSKTGKRQAAGFVKVSLKYLSQGNRNLGKSLISSNLWFNASMLSWNEA